jgi:AraC-like DNA-binding protein
LKNGFAKINLTTVGMDVRTLAGTMAEYSTEDLHTHGHHQVLRINSGVALLVDEDRRQPMFGALTAFIPADLAHRSVVWGGAVNYKSIYLARELLPYCREEITLFFISPLGAALFDRIQIWGAQDLAQNLNRECLDLLLKLLPKEMEAQADLVRLPEPTTTLARKVVRFVEKRCAWPLSMDDFSKAFPYSGRHLARLFKEEMGITLFEYVRLYRILMASLALGDPDKAITQIGLDCGYASLSSFYRDFHLVYGVAPKFFREKFSAEAVPA